MELEDLVYTYPPISPGFQTKISAKQEFKEVSGVITEYVPEKGELFRHQKLIKRYLLQYDDLLLLHQAGVGKTLTAVGVTEHYKKLADSLVETMNGNVPYKRAIVLVKGDNLANEFKQQILCKTDGSYITEAIINAKTETSRKNLITRSIGKFYTITTYEKFAKAVFRLTNQQLKDQFNNTIFIVDEVHNINKDTSQGILGVDPRTGNKYYYKMETKAGETKQNIINSRLIYDQLWRTFHTVIPRKVMLLSATPMINDVSEIGPRLNLILPEDNQIPENTDFNTITLNQLKPYAQGFVSYVRQLDTGADPVYQGKTLKGKIKIGDKTVDSQMVVYGSEMSEKQLKVYKKAETDPSSLRPDSTKSDAFDDLKRQASNFVYPDDSTGTYGYRKYVIEEGNTITANPELYQWISKMEYLKSLSNKFGTIVEKCKNDPGNCWCYSNYIIGSGANVLGLCFEAQGFERFSENTSIFASGFGGGLGDVCGSDVDKTKNRFVRIPKKLRYALLTSETTNVETAILLEAFNSYENRYGEYIKVVIGSPTARDGINLANVLQIHLVGPGWNEATTYQAESRAIRSTSHVDLLEEKRQEYIKLGKDPNTAKIEIKVYRHASLDNEGKGIDIHMYKVSERKDRQIKRVIRMLKQISFDCQLNYNRNVRPTDVNYSATCDYDICAYKCVESSPDYVDYTSYDVLYSGKVVDEIIKMITDIFRVTFSISYNALYSELAGYNKRFIDEALFKLVVEKMPIIDRYGYKSYLREDRGTLFLRRDYPLNSVEKPGNVSLSEYTSTLLGILPKSLREYVGESKEGEQRSVIEVLATKVGTPEFDIMIDDLTLENKINLVEAAIYQYGVLQKTSLYIEAVIQKFRPFIFSTYEPIGALDASKEALAKRGKGRGRKPKAGSKFRLNDKAKAKVLERLNEQGTELVYYHNLSSATEALTAYAVTSKSRKTEGKIRLIKAIEGKWRDGLEYEEPVYNTIIKEKIEKEQRELEGKFDIYGTIADDGKFRIVDKTTEDMDQSSIDTRKVNRGRICNNGWKKPDLINILWKLRINPFKINVDLTQEEIRKYLIKTGKIKQEEVDAMIDAQAKFFYIWYTSGIGRGGICKMLQKELEKMDRIVRK